MARLIDADELVAELIYLYEDRGWHEREIHFSLAECDVIGDCMGTDGYCAWGERREDADS